MKVRIVSRDNGWGLSKDIQVLRDAILRTNPEAQVEFCDWQHQPASRVDIQFFLELLPAHLFDLAGRNIMVPNPEWFERPWLARLGRCTEVWAKTADCLRIFSRYHRKVVFSGWTSPDRLLPDVPRAMELVHLAGNSSAKGTQAVLEAMALLPEHSLTLVTRKSYACPSNVRAIEHLSDSEFMRLQNRARIHLCPSSYEGFGHYINEALSVGALVITTASEPMTDLVQPSFGIGVRVRSTSLQHLAQHRHVDPVELAEAIRAAMSAPAAVIEELGRRSREAYLSTRDAFHTRVTELLR